LIELLVVIAIIGILSSVVLASLTTARSKGNDAAITSELSNMRAQAELFYSNNNNSYGSTTAANTLGATCVTQTLNLFGSTSVTGSLKTLFEDVIKKAGPGKTWCSVSATGDAWAVSASTSAGNWCVDSTGKSVDKTMSGTAGACN
jgi:Tfp pilus assembly protein PilE